MPRKGLLDVIRVMESVLVIMGRFFLEVGWSFMFHTSSVVLPRLCSPTARSELNVNTLHVLLRVINQQLHM